MQTQTKPTFTPGPWSVVQGHARGQFHVYADEELVAIIPRWSLPADAGDARLIAKAPELYELVVRAINLPESGGAHWLNQARQLLADIEGA